MTYPPKIPLSALILLSLIGLRSDSAYGMLTTKASREFRYLTSVSGLSG